MTKSSVPFLDLPAQQARIKDDLRRRLDLALRDPAQLPMNVVVRSDDGAVSLLVDEIGDVVEIQDDSYERLPETLTGVARELIRGVYKLKEQLLLVLDTERTVNLPGAYTPAHAETK